MRALGSEDSPSPYLSRCDDNDDVVVEVVDDGADDPRTGFC